MSAKTETHQFQAETKHLLDLMIHSLYTNKEIFLRELISNASDALDRLRFESLTQTDLLKDSDKLEIRLEVDRETRALTISDTGIGMSREEVISNIGTIAKSGTRELREKIAQADTKEKAAELIGQFGVGFYSAFMVADSVTLVTRRAGEKTATRWESTGDGQYEISTATRPASGTSITLKLKPADPENGMEDYTDNWVITNIVKNHSDFINYPIIIREEREEPASEKDAPPTIVVEDKTLNSMKPLWQRPAAEVAESEYEDFYKQLTHAFDTPLKTLFRQAEGTLEYKALLFIPSQAPTGLFYQGFEYGLRLYARGVSVVEQCSELLPGYLRFIRGVVDSSDLPLNISRQRLQQDRHLAIMQKWLTKKILEALQEMFKNEYEQYLKFWEQFGRALKEGLTSDFDNKDKITPLLLFHSSRDAEKLTTLRDYVARMREGQEEIYYLTGESKSVVENSPHLEAFREQNYEVLYLIDTIDEIMVQFLFDFEGKRLKSIGKGTVTLGNEAEKEQRAKELQEKETEFSDLLQFIREKLDENVKEARLSNRLTVSPACLVGAEFDISPQVERLMQMSQGGLPKQKRILELNPKHEIVAKMYERFKANRDDAQLAGYAELLLGYAFLAEGSDLPDPVRFNRVLAEVMAHTL